MVRGGNIDCIELLLQHKANIEAATSDDKTSLHIAADNEQLPAVKCLLAKGAQGTSTDDYGLLPLHYACCKGHVQVVRFLLEHCPATVNCTTPEDNGH